MDSTKACSEIILRMNMTERKKKLFGDTVRRGGLQRQIIEGKMEGKGDEDDHRHPG